MTLYLIIINILAAFGIVYILYIISEIKEYCKSKHQEQFKRDVLLDIIKEYEEKNDA